MRFTTSDAEELSLALISEEYNTEAKARKLLESLRWPDGPVCPHCQNHKEKPIYPIKVRTSENTRKGLYCCGACRQQFSVTSGTIMHGSHAPIHKWLLCFFLIASAKEEISSHQLMRSLKTTYRTAWHMSHRIRHALASAHESTALLDGTLEVDECYVGPKSDVRHSQSSKQAVCALVQRGGRVKTRVVSSVSQINMRLFITDCASKTATLNSDEHPSYKNQFRDFQRHDVVTHARREYSRTNPDRTKSGVNSAESFFSLIRRSIIGSFHHVSKQHLPKYASEIEFRWNHRKITDGERMAKAINTIAGKRLVYKMHVSKA